MSKKNKSVNFAEILSFMEAIHTEAYFLSAGESNAEQELSLPLLVTRLIDIATAHANSLGIGNPSMSDINGGWILSRLTVEMYCYPKVDTEFLISTWVEDTNRHFSTRAFKIFNAEGFVFGYARSIWLVMDTVNHTNLGLAHLNFPTEMIDGSQVPIARQPRHIPIVTGEEDKVNSKSVLVASGLPFDYKFQYCDLDFYRHVNTVRYVNLLLNRFSLREHDETFIHRLELSFLHEAKYDMDTQLLRSDLDSPLHSAFQLSRKNDGQPLFFARVLREFRP